MYLCGSGVPSSSRLSVERRGGWGCADLSPYPASPPTMPWLNISRNIPPHSTTNYSLWANMTRVPINPIFSTFALVSIKDVRALNTVRILKLPHLYSELLKIAQCLFYQINNFYKNKYKMTNYNNLKLFYE